MTYINKEIIKTLSHHWKENRWDRLGLASQLYDWHESRPVNYRVGHYYAHYPHKSTQYAFQMANL